MGTANKDASILIREMRAELERLRTEFETNQRNSIIAGNNPNDLTNPNQAAAMLDPEIMMPFIRDNATLKIQCFWRKCLARRLNQQLTNVMNKEMNERVMNEKKINNLLRENASLKIQSMRHYRNRHAMERNARIAIKERAEALRDLERKAEDKAIAEMKAKLAKSESLIAEREAEVKKAQADLEHAASNSVTAAKRASLTRIQSIPKSFGVNVKQMVSEAERKRHDDEHNKVHREAFEDAETKARKALVEEKDALLKMLQVLKAETKALQIEHEQDIREREAQTNSLIRENASLETRLRQANDEIDELHAKINSLEAQHASMSDSNASDYHRNNKPQDLSRGTELSESTMKNQRVTVKNPGTQYQQQHHMDFTFNPSSASSPRSSVGSLRSLGTVHHHQTLQPHPAATQLQPHQEHPRPGGRTTIAQAPAFCIRVNVETFEEHSSQFLPVSSTSNVTKDTRIFHVKGPLYDLKLSRWSRFVVKILDNDKSRGFAIEDISDVRLEHLPFNAESSGSRSERRQAAQEGCNDPACVSHSLRVVKTDLEDRSSAVVMAVCDWDSESFDPNAHCFCFSRAVDDSGPMMLRANVFVTGVGKVGFEYPMRFKHVKDNVFDKMGLKQLSAVTNGVRGGNAPSEIRHAYVNAVWYSLERVQKAQDENHKIGSSFFNGSFMSSSASSSMYTVENNLVPIRDEEHVVEFAGYLMKKQSHAGGRVQRWFVLAPPFLLCYSDAKRAAQDFGKTKVMPNRANRALLLSRSARVNVIAPPREAESSTTVGIDFEISTDEKVWNLQAGNREDMKRWVSVLENVIATYSSIPATLGNVLVPSSSSSSTTAAVATNTTSSQFTTGVGGGTRKHISMAVPTTSSYSNTNSVRVKSYAVGSRPTSEMYSSRTDLFQTKISRRDQEEQQRSPLRERNY